MLSSLVGVLIDIPAAQLLDKSAMIRDLTPGPTPSSLARGNGSSLFSICRWQLARTHCSISCVM